MSKEYANVIVDISRESLDRSFQYLIPESMQEILEAGMVVIVPFGKGSRRIKGYVVEITNQAKIDREKMKEIIEIATEASPVESHLIALASWMRNYYGGTMIQALKTVIPVKQKIKPKEKKSVKLLVTKAEAEEKLAFCLKKNQRARARLIETLIENEEVPMEFVTGKLHVSSSVVKALEAQNVLECTSRILYRNPVKITGEIHYQLQLNDQQQGVCEQIIKEWNRRDSPVYLIHGVTGSGKTEIYMELIANAIEKGQQAIVLIPEIALTYQTVMRFYRRFGEKISIMNSKLSPGERYDQFVRARNGLIDVMIGPRSALFTPFQNLGIIIMDEEHEESYKSETVPRYQARETAIARARIEHARVVLGSATPSMDAYYKAKQGDYRLFTIKNRARQSTLPTIEIVDMRKEIEKGNSSILSNDLRNKIQQRLENHQQIMLFLNRRGYAGFLSCRSCGNVISCPHCDVALSLHNNGKLICHYCGYEEMVPQTCPSCESAFLRDYRVGTQQVQEQLEKEFPQAGILRMDLDTTKQKDGHEKILTAFANREADILIGTQMIVKGHDFPMVTLVGVLSADLSLYANDFRASERTFQLLTQAAGRAGRGNLSGEVVIQTFHPENYSITFVKNQDYEGFYEQEILYRQLAGYPPIAGMLAIHGSAKSMEYLQIAMKYLRDFIDFLVKSGNIQVLGPTDEAIAKINDIYRKVIYVKYQDKQVLIRIKNKMEQYIGINEGFRSVTIQFDMQ